MPSNLLGEGDLRSFDFAQLVPGFKRISSASTSNISTSETEVQDLDLEGLRRYLEALPCCALGAIVKPPATLLTLL